MSQTNVFEKYKDTFAGVWSLLTYEMWDSDGPGKKLLYKPHGDEPLGKVVISGSGYLSAILIPPSVLVPLKSSDTLMGATDEELARIARPLSAYSGFMTLHETDQPQKFVWHTKVEVSANPNWIGKDQTRRVEYFETDDGEKFMTLNPVKDYPLPVSFVPNLCKKSNQVPMREAMGS